MAEHLRRDVSDPLAAEFGVPLEVDASPEVEQHQRAAVVHRQGESVAAYSGLGAQSPIDGFAQHDRHVLHRVVFVDVQIAAGLHFERHAAVVGDLRQHVVQKTQSGRNPVAAVSIVAVPVVVVPFVTAAVVDPAVVISVVAVSVVAVPSVTVVVAVAVSVAAVPAGVVPFPCRIFRPGPVAFRSVVCVRINRVFRIRAVLRSAAGSGGRTVWRNAAEPFAVEVEPDGDPRFAGLARYDHPPFAAADVLGDLGPRIADQHAGLFRSGFAQHPAARRLLCEQNSPRSEIAGQQDVGRAVADDVTRREVVPSAGVAAEHSRAGLARRGAVAFERAVDQHVVEQHAFARQRAEHLLLRNPEILLRKGVGSQSVLIGGHHQLEIESPEDFERRNGSGHEFQLGEAVHLHIHGRLDDQRAVAVYEQCFFECFFHGLKFLTVSSMRPFSAGVPTVIRRQPSHPVSRVRLRTITPAAISSP